MSTDVTMADSNRPGPETPYKLDLTQTEQACKVLQQNILKARQERESEQVKRNLLEEQQSSDKDASMSALSDVPVWMILTGKKHILDRERLKPSKIRLPHPPQTKTDISICLITADPQRLYKNVIADPAFPNDLRARIGRVIGLEKLKAKYKSFESRRQLLAEHDFFFADDRIWTYLPNTLGKHFFQNGGSKRPIPVQLEKRSRKKQVPGAVRRSTKGTDGNGAISASAMAKELQTALDSAVVHLSTSNTSAVKVATAATPPAQSAANTQAVIEGITSKLLPGGWRNVRAIHLKGPETPAFPIWLADQLWSNDEDVRDQAKVLGAKKRKRRPESKGQADEKKSAGAEGVERKKKLRTQKAGVLAEASED